MLRYTVKVVIAVVLGIVVGLWVAHHTFDKPNTHYFNPAATTTVFSPASAAYTAPKPVPTPTTTTTVKPAPVVAQAAPTAPPVTAPAPPPTNVATQQAYEHCLTVATPALCASQVPGPWTQARPTTQTLPASCPPSGVETETHTTYDPATGDSSVGYLNIYCGLGQSGYEWCPPKLTMPGQPVQTGLDYTRCEA